MGEKNHECDDNMAVRHLFRLRGCDFENPNFCVFNLGSLLFHNMTRIRCNEPIKVLNVYRARFMPELIPLPICDKIKDGS